MRRLISLYAIAAIVCLMAGPASAATWEIMDAGLQDTTNFVNQGGGTESRSDIAGDPGTRFTLTLTGSGWTDTQIGDGFDLPSNNAGLVAATGNSGDLSAYAGYTMTIKNPGSAGFLATLYMNTGWTDPPWNHTDCYYQNTSAWTWVGPGQTVTLTLDFLNAAYWNGSAWVQNQVVQNLAYVTNIGLKVGGNLGTSGEIQSGTAFDVDVVSNILELNPQALYIKTNANLTVDMDVKHLLQRVNACQAMLGYDSTYFLTTGTVAAGGGVWDLVIYNSWSAGSGSSQNIDTAIGVNAYGATGTDADATVAKITLTSGSTEGTTTMVFRPDASPDPGLTASTFLSDMSASPVWPMKYNSQNIVIDGTSPTVDNISATQSSGPELTPCSSGNVAVQGQVDIVVTVSDNLSGIAAVPTVTVTDSGSTVTDITASGVDNGGGVYSYTYTVGSGTANGCATISVTVTDKSGNSGSGSDGFDINKNQIAGTVSMDTYSSASYSFNRSVTFVATDVGNNVLKTWTPTLSFVNNTGTKIATGSYTVTDVPGGIVNLSAKTAWSMRKRNIGIALVGGQAVSNFMLKGGDINASNSVNVLDYSLLKVNWGLPGAADINGDGAAQLLDYSIMKNYWFNTGDPQ